MKVQKGAPELLYSLTKMLPEMLGPNYSVVPPYLSFSETGSSVYGNPDIVVHHRHTGKYVLVGVKGAQPSDDLPFATVPMLRKLKEANKELSPDIVLISTSKISSELKEKFNSDDVKVIEGSFDDQIISADKIASLLADLIVE